MAVGVSAPGFPWRLIFIFLLLAAAIAVSGYISYEKHAQHVLKAAQTELSSIEELKVREVVRWRTERMDDAKLISEDAFLASRVRQWLADPANAGLREEILQRLASLRRNSDYDSVVLLDSKGVPRLSIPEGLEVVSPPIQSLAVEAMGTKKVLLSDFYLSPVAGNSIRISLATPLLVSPAADVPAVGALLIRIDPGRFLYPYIQSWPIRSATSESLLVRREGNQVVFLSETRHQKNTALNLQFPANEPELPAAMAVRGQVGVVRGRDYRGERVLAAICPIPDSPWFLVAKVDMAEVSAPIHESFWRATIVAGAMIAAAGAILGLFWVREHAKLLHRLHEAELERLALSRHFDYLTKYAHDIILLVDKDLNIVECNDRALESYGYTRDELLRMSLPALLPPDLRAALPARLRQLEGSDGLVFEAVHQRKDGATFPVEVSSRIIQLDGNKCYQSIVRDITERKRAEQELRESEQRFRELYDHAPVGYHELDTEGRIRRVNRTELAMLGYTAEEMVGRRVWEFVVESDAARQAVLAKLAGLLPPGRQTERTYRRKNGSTIPVLVEDRALMDERGKIVGLRSTVQDITERKQVEQALQQAERKYRSIFENAVEGIYQSTPDGRILSANSAMARIHGYDSPEELMAAIQDAAHQLYVDPSRREELKRLLAERGEVRDFENQAYRKDGTVIWTSANLRAVRDANGKTLFYEGTVEDVTERKRYEQELKRLNEELERLAVTDTLTGLYNRRKFDELLNEAIQRTRRSISPLSLVFFDIDFFKQLNDTHGHPAGDDVLKALSAIVQEHKRVTDYLARIGGEEFAILAAETNLKGARILAEKLRKLVEGHPFPHNLRITISLGVAEYRSADTPGALIARADESLYRAKHNGRNRVEWAA